MQLNYLTEKTSIDNFKFSKRKEFVSNDVIYCKKMLKIYDNYSAKERKTALDSNRMLEYTIILTNYVCQKGQPLSVNHIMDRSFIKNNYIFRVNSKPIDMDRFGNPDNTDITKLLNSKDSKLLYSISTGVGQFITGEYLNYKYSIAFYVDDFNLCFPYISTITSNNSDDMLRDVSSFAVFDPRFYTEQHYREVTGLEYNFDCNYRQYPYNSTISFINENTEISYIKTENKVQMYENGIYKDITSGYLDSQLIYSKDILIGLAKYCMFNSIDNITIEADSKSLFRVIDNKYDKINIYLNDKNIDDNFKIDLIDRVKNNLMYMIKPYAKIIFEEDFRILFNINQKHASLDIKFLKSNKRYFISNPIDVIIFDFFRQLQNKELDLVNQIKQKKQGRYLNI